MFIIFEGPAFTGKTSCIRFLSNAFGFKKVPEWILDDKKINLPNSKANDLKKVDFCMKMGQKIILVDRLMFATGVYNALEIGSSKISQDIVSLFKLIEKTGFFNYTILVLLFKIDADTGLERGKNTNRYKESLIWYKDLEKTYNLYYQTFKLCKNNIEVIEIDASHPVKTMCFYIKNIISCKGV